MTELLSVFTELMEAFEKVTEADVVRSQRRLGKVRPGEKTLGTLHSDSLKRAWALSDYYESVEAQAKLEAKFKAETEEQILELFQQGVRAEALAEAARDLFWLQARDDIGSVAWRSSGNIGLRADWMLVAAPPEAHPLQALLGGVVRLPPPEE